MSRGEFGRSVPLMVSTSLIESRPYAGPRVQTPRVRYAKRRFVTVLVADIEGSMSLSGALDVEEFWLLMSDFFSLLCTGVERFEGRVDRFTGDGAIAVFGASGSCADHAHRACRAALWLREALSEHARALRRERGFAFSVRIGLESGEVMFGTLGCGPSAHETVIGHTAGIAKRMESAAMPGTVCLTEHAAALIRDRFDLVEIGVLDVKGAQRPMKAFELAGERP